MILDTHAGRFDRLYTFQVENDWCNDTVVISFGDIRYLQRNTFNKPV